MVSLWDAEDIENVISRAVTAAVREDAAKVEAACEDALQGGEHGVYVLRLGSRVVLAEVSDLVPYGEIYEFHEPWGRTGSWQA
jgi:hypothetical protein